MDTEKLNIVREEPNTCRVKLNIEVPREEVEKTFSEIENEFKKHADIPGFRKGKAPRSILEKKYGDRIADEAKQRLLQEALRTAVMQEEVTPETAPNIDNEDQLEANREQDFVFAVEFDIQPQFELPDYKNIQLSKNSTQVESEDIESTISNVLQQRTTYEPVDRPAQAGDLLKATYHGRLADGGDEELSESARYILEATETWITLAEPEMIPGITEKLEGVGPDSKHEIKVEFPEDFYEDKLAGKKADYTVHVHEVQASQTPELTDEMARELGADSAEQVREIVKDNLRSQQDQEEQQRLRTEIVNNLLEKVDFDLPQEALRRQTYQALNNIYQQKQQEGVSQEELQQQQQELYQQAEQQAKEDLKRRYLLLRIAREEGLQVGSEEVERMISTLSQYHQIPEKQLKQRLQENGGIYELYDNLLENKTVEHLISLADIDDPDAEEENEETVEADSSGNSEDEAGEQSESDSAEQ